MHSSVAAHEVHQEVEAVLGGQMDIDLLEDDVIEEEEAGASGSPVDSEQEAACRDSDNAISNFETIIHLLKGNIGIGEGEK